MIARLYGMYHHGLALQLRITEGGKRLLQKLPRITLQVVP